MGREHGTITVIPTHRVVLCSYNVLLVCTLSFDPKHEPDVSQVTNRRLKAFLGGTAGKERTRACPVLCSRCTSLLHVGRKSEYAFTSKPLFRPLSRICSHLLLCRNLPFSLTKASVVHPSTPLPGTGVGYPEMLERLT